MKHLRYVFIVALLILAGATTLSARSVLEGLEIVEDETGGGVEVLSLTASSPAAVAMMQAGDRIVKVDGRSISNLDSYVSASKQASGKKKIVVEYYRGGTRRSVELSLYSIPLQEKWGVNIMTRAETPPSAESDPAGYWAAQAKKRIRANEKKGEHRLAPEDYGDVILSLFSSLEAAPDSLTTAMLIARQYGRLAVLYGGMGEKEKAIWCFRRALLLCNDSTRKGRDIQDMVIVKHGLDDLRKEIANLR
jgi:membrane-associated protease RseP (regulator of RpoE activity)